MALRLTAVQNRMALDMLLAKEGGVCHMVGEHCCTYIPPNDAEHVNITAALDEMAKVAKRLQMEEYGEST